MQDMPVDLGRRNCPRTIDRVLCIIVRMTVLLHEPIRLVRLRIYICEWSVLLYGRNRIGVHNGTDLASIFCLE